MSRRNSELPPTAATEILLLEGESPLYLFRGNTCVREVNPLSLKWGPWGNASSPN